MATQQIYGAVDPNGQIIAGQGFNLTRIKIGTYYIQFRTPFTALPVPTCTILGTPWKVCNLSIAIVEFDRTGFYCETSSPMQPVDCGFTFTVSGEMRPLEPIYQDKIKERKDKKKNGKILA